VRPKELGQLNNPMTSSKIEKQNAAFRSWNKGHTYIITSILMIADDYPVKRFPRGYHRPRPVFALSIPRSLHKTEGEHQNTVFQENEKKKLLTGMKKTCSKVPSHSVLYEISMNDYGKRDKER
jgi:hypothetical protein